MAQEPECISLLEQCFLSSARIQTACEAYPAFVAEGTWGFSPKDKGDGT
jgi:hypothetical protein